MRQYSGVSLNLLLRFVAQVTYQPGYLMGSGYLPTGYIQYGRLATSKHFRFKQDGDAIIVAKDGSYALFFHAYIQQGGKFYGLNINGHNCTKYLSK